MKFTFRQLTYFIAAAKSGSVTLASKRDGRRVYRVPLSGDPPPVHIGIATLKRLKRTCLVEAFERHCQELISDNYIPGMVAAKVPNRRKRH